ncbi:MAG: nicotinamide riboside transporter PnuC [Sphingomicrobium sp.]
MVTAFLEPFRDYLEWIAAFLGLVTVILVVRRSIWNYPFALAMVAFYFFEFAAEKLYSDALLQIFFFLINCYGWWMWRRAPEVEQGVAVERMGGRARSFWLASTALGSVFLGWVMATLTDAAAPFVDAAIAGSSIAAQWLQSLRRVESWTLWIVADLIAVPLYWWKGLYPTAGLYAVFLALAIIGMISWQRTLGREAA